MKNNKEMNKLNNKTVNKCNKYRKVRIMNKKKHYNK